jgi:hypothetical protein
MKPYRKTAIFVGIFFLVGYVILLPGSLLFIDPILDAPDFLIGVSANQPQVIIGMFLELLNTAAVVGIAVLMFPLLKKQNEALALGYVGSRIVESAILLVGHIFLLLLIILSQEYVKAAAPASHFQTLGNLFIAERRLTFQWVPLIVTLGALMFYYLLYQSKLIPRWLSIWGLIGVPFSLVAFGIAMFGLRAGASMPTSAIIFNLPIGLNEVVLGIWLIVKGFNPSAIASQST